MPLAGRRILIVEDESLIAMMVEDALTEARATVLGPAPSLRRALDLVAAEPMDAAVLDLDLGGENALPVADALAARGIPFLVATGFGSRYGLPGHEGVHVLHKPFEPEQVVVALARLLG
jgi:DNA-binding response OmpR family regulator